MSEDGEKYSETPVFVTGERKRTERRKENPTYAITGCETMHDSVKSKKNPTLLFYFIYYNNANATQIIDALFSILNVLYVCHSNTLKKKKKTKLNKLRDALKKHLGLQQR